MIKFSPKLILSIMSYLFFYVDRSSIGRSPRSGKVLFWDRPFIETGLYAFNELLNVSSIICMGYFLLDFDSCFLETKHREEYCFLWNCYITLGNVLVEVQHVVKIRTSMTIFPGCFVGTSTIADCRSCNFFKDCFVWNCSILLTHVPNVEYLNCKFVWYSRKRLYVCSNIRLHFCLETFHYWCLEHALINSTVFLLWCLWQGSSAPFLKSILMESSFLPQRVLGTCEATSTGCFVGTSTIADYQSCNFWKDCFVWNCFILLTNVQNGVHHVCKFVWYSRERLYVYSNIRLHFCLGAFHYWCLEHALLNSTLFLLWCLWWRSSAPF